MMGIVAWLSFGFGFWAATSIFRWHTFEKATAMSVLRGLLLCVVIWPVGIVLVVMHVDEERFYR